jgi:hypothetical protein
VNSTTFSRLQLSAGLLTLASLPGLLGPAPARALEQRRPLGCARAPLFSLIPEGRPNFYRVMRHERQGAERLALDQAAYGTDHIIYLDDGPEALKAAGIPFTREADGSLKIPDGMIWHNATDELRLFKGGRQTSLSISRPEVVEKLQFKIPEAQELTRYVPDAIPRTSPIAEFIQRAGADLRAASQGSLEDKVRALEKVLAEVRKVDPNGYFLKLTDGFSSGGGFASEKTRIAETLKDYYENILPLREKLMAELGDEVEVHYRLKGRPNYEEGMTLDRLLRAPEEVLVQEKKKLVFGGWVRDGEKYKRLPKEFRVHTLRGKVLKGWTQHRWGEVRNLKAADITEIEDFVQGVMNRLPPELRDGWYGMDVVFTEDGKYIIELNATEVGDMYPEINLWITQKLAEYHTGVMTPTNRAFEAFQKAPTFAEKQKLLDAFFERPEVKWAGRQADDAISEYRFQAKETLFEELARRPHPSVANAVLRMIKKYSLGQDLSTAQIEHLGTMLARAGADGGELAGAFRFAPNEYLMINADRSVKFVQTNYDNELVLAKLEALAQEMFPNSPEATMHGLPAPGAPGPATGLETRLRRLVREHVLPVEELWRNPRLGSVVATDINAARAPSTRLLYKGSREGIIQRLLKRVAN